ncbi:ABC transporter ATP-binding protein [Candidimonas humi]|uniref:ABC transporter ATP-binding protein n=1 Tax=Candidimonas humi TaxID=683355 RepID=A0ABV8P330_9BURK|nr:ABC transporter ATP-binding protein [Candidimonas humi]
MAAIAMVSEPGASLARPQAQPLLDVQAVDARFGGVQALKGASLRVAPNEICALIGPNGAGKTTLFNCISRVYTVTAGSIHYRGIDITRVPRHAIAGLGIARTFQNLGLVPGLSVLDNVLLGAHSRIRPSFWRPLLPVAAQRSREALARRESLEILDWLGLADHASRLTGELAFGTLKRVELARALVARPSLVMLDEPANGLAHGEVDALAELILDMRKRFGVAVLLVEHHMQMVLRISDRVAVLELGSLIAHGTPDEIRKNPRVIEAYLGASV